MRFGYSTVILKGVSLITTKSMGNPNTVKTSEHV